MMARSALFSLNSPFDLPPECNVLTYAIYKPRGVLSRTGFDTIKHPNVRTNNVNTRSTNVNTRRRRTLTDLMVAADLKPLSKHIGRLDLETGGLILVTEDALLLEAALSMPGAISIRLRTETVANTATNGDTTSATGRSEINRETEIRTPLQPLTKTYELLLAGRYQHDSAAIEQLRTPLKHTRGGQVYDSNGATVHFTRCFRSVELATEYTLLDCHNADGDDEKYGTTVETRREAIRTEREIPIVSRQTGKSVRPFVHSDGWLTELTVTIHQGRHHQIRRLCARAGFKLRHLRRVSFGPIQLGGSMQPGDVRILGMEEKSQLYRACVPYLEGAHERRTQAMEVARKARIEQPTDRPIRKSKERHI